MTKLEEAIKWFDERIVIQPAGKIIFPRFDDNINTIKYWKIIKNYIKDAK